MRTHRPWLAILTAVLLCSASWPERTEGAVEVTSCGTTVVTDNAYLSGNLDCTGHPFEMFGAAVTLRNSRLDLRGFSIVTTDPDIFDLNGDGITGVLCEPNCLIDGPGTISGFENGIFYLGTAVVSEVTVANSWFDGIVGWNSGGGLWLSGSTIVDNKRSGLRTEYARVRDSTIARNGFAGVSGAWQVKVSGSTIVDNGHVGISSSMSNVGVLDSQVTGNGTGVAAYGLRGSVWLKNSRVEDNGDWGIRAHGEINLRDSIVDGNGGDGASAEGGRVRLRGNSSVRGNGTICAGTSPCADVVSVRPPAKADTASCDTSLTSDRTSTWGICSAD